MRLDSQKLPRTTDNHFRNVSVRSQFSMQPAFTGLVKAPDISESLLVPLFKRRANDSSRCRVRRQAVQRTLPDEPRDKSRVFFWPKSFSVARRQAEAPPNTAFISGLNLSPVQLVETAARAAEAPEGTDLSTMRFVVDNACCSPATARCRIP